MRYLKKPFLIIRSVLLNKQIPVKILLHSSINQIQENWLAKEINNYCDVPLKFVNHIQEVPDLVITDKNNPLFTPVKLLLASRSLFRRIL